VPFRFRAERINFIITGIIYLQVLLYLYYYFSGVWIPLSQRKICIVNHTNTTSVMVHDEQASSCDSTSYSLCFLHCTMVHNFLFNCLAEGYGTWSNDPANSFLLCHTIAMLSSITHRLVRNFTRIVHGMWPSSTKTSQASHCTMFASYLPLLLLALWALCHLSMIQRQRARQRLLIWNYI
jgi:hypothetical protein